MHALASDISIGFDGAVRGNGTTGARSAIGIHVNTDQFFANPLCYGRTLQNCSGNGTAELRAAIAAARLALEISSVRTILHAVLSGDARYVISTILSGRLLLYDATCRLVNAQDWNELRMLCDALTQAGVEVTWSWVPRHRNRMADEWANAALDNRPPNTDVRNVDGAIALTEAKVSELVLRCCSSRQRTLRTLPSSLLPLWCHFITSIVERYTHTHTHTFLRMLVWCAPVVISHNHPSIRSRSDFKSLRAHLTLLQQNQYLHDTIEDILSNPPMHSSSAPPSPDEAKTLDVLCSRGLPDKCLKTSPSTVASPSPDTVKSFASFFPQADLPEPIDENGATAAACLCTFSQVLRAARSLKRGTSPGLCGWTSELLMGALTMCCPTVRNAWVEVFTRILAGRISAAEKSLLQTSVGVPLFVPSKNKIRPLQIFSTFRKVAWKIALEDKVTSDPMLSASGQCAFRVGASQTASHILHSLVDAGYTVIAQDGVNAFNCASRRAMRAHVHTHRTHYSSAIALWNMCYAEAAKVLLFGPDGLPYGSVSVSTGSAQGCVSAQWSFSTATCKSMCLHRYNHVSIVDDLYTFDRDPQTALNIADQVCSSLETDVSLSLHKYMILTPAPLANIVVPPRFAAATVSTSVIHFLGTFASYRHAHPAAVQSATKLIAEKFKIKINALRDLTLVPNARKQCLWQVLIAASRHFQYFARTLNPDVSHSIFTSLDEQLMAIADLILPHWIPAHEVQSFLATPLVHRGLGLLPYSLLHEHMWAEAAVIAAPVMRQLNVPLRPPTQRSDPSLISAWKRLTRTSTSQLSHSPHWISQWPATPSTRLSNAEFDFFVANHVDRLQPRNYLCTLTCIQLTTLDTQAYTKHVKTCAHCGAIAFHLRHEGVNNALHRTLKRHGVSSTLNPPDLPRPENSRGGPDLMVYHQVGPSEVAGGVAQCITAVDVAITTERLVVARRNFKLRAYREFANRTSFSILPFIMDNKGFHTEACITFLRNLVGVAPDLVPQALVETQFALLRGQMRGLLHLHARAPQPTPLLIYDSADTSVIATVNPANTIDHLPSSQTVSHQGATHASPASSTVAQQGHPIMMPRRTNSIVSDDVHVATPPHPNDADRLRASASNPPENVVHLNRPQGSP
jgi:ribonuclease HI